MSKFRFEKQDSYRGGHKAPNQDDRPMHDVVGAYPEDFYEDNTWKGSFEEHI